MDIEDYDRDRAEKKLLMKLQEAEETVKAGEGWLSLDELKILMREQDMLELRINPLVATDLKEIRGYIAEDTEEYAAKTLKEIYGKFENIQGFSGMGSAISKRVSFRTDYNYAVWENYVIIYKVGKKYVEIYRAVNRLGILRGFLIKDQAISAYNHQLIYQIRKIKTKIFRIFFMTDG